MVLKVQLFALVVTQHPGENIILVWIVEASTRILIYEHKIVEVANLSCLPSFYVSSLFECLFPLFDQILYRQHPAHLYSLQNSPGELIRVKNDKE